MHEDFNKCLKKMDEMQEEAGSSAKRLRWPNKCFGFMKHCLFCRKLCQLQKGNRSPWEMDSSLSMSLYSFRAWKQTVQLAFTWEMWCKSWQLGRWSETSSTRCSDLSPCRGSSLSQGLHESSSLQTVAQGVRKKQVVCHEGKADLALEAPIKAM